MLDIKDLIVYVDGQFVPGPDAKISVFDRGLLYGDAIFEGIREYSGRVFKLDEHLEHLLHRRHERGVRDRALQDLVWVRRWVASAPRPSSLDSSLPLPSRSSANSGT